MRFLLPLALLATSACAGVTPYVRSGYDSTSANATKHITIAAWAEDDETGRLVARIASERVKFKSNYLVHEERQVAPGWSAGCSTEDETVEIQGVLELRVVSVLRDAESVSLDLEGRLMRCVDGAMLWRATVQGTKVSVDEDLATFVESYIEEFPATAEPLAIPLLVNLIELLDTLPDVVLTEDEEITKIELSSGPKPEPPHQLS